jgi:hypothetical protein
MPNWIEEGGQIMVEHEGKCCCISQNAKGVWIAEKKVRTGWQKIRAIEAVTREEAVAELQQHLGL